jgi:hypothetical protein
MPETVTCSCLLDAAHQPLSDPDHVLDDRLVLVDVHGRHHRGEPVRLAAVRGRHQEDARLVPLLQVAEAHVLALARER